MESDRSALISSQADADDFSDSQPVFRPPPTHQFLRLCIHLEFFRPASHLPLGGQLDGGVEADLAAYAEVRAGVIEDIDRAFDDFRIAGRVTILKRWNSTSCSS